MNHPGGGYTSKGQSSKQVFLLSFFSLGLNKENWVGWKIKLFYLGVQQTVTQIF